MAKTPKKDPKATKTCPPHDWVISVHIATCTKCKRSQDVS